ncbi:MAG: hypothetical protein H0V34_05540 [Gammaproteobacteria bacterium]|nr:hypothetical protein [Gammaproteobacteria bacterium]
MAAVATFAFSSIAQAIPPGQRDFDTGPVSTFSQSLAIVPNTSVTVNNGSSARDCEQDRGIIRERL